MPSFNEITGARISSGAHVKGTDREKFDSNWDAIFGKPRLPSEDDDIFGKKAEPVVGKPHLNIQTFTDCCLDCGENIYQVKFCTKNKEPVEEPKVVVSKKDWSETCEGYIDCPFCDNGYFPCNQNCVMLA